MKHFGKYYYKTVFILFALTLIYYSSKQKPDYPHIIFFSVTVLVSVILYAKEDIKDSILNNHKN
jgi:hypothetical protein